MGTNIEKLLSKKKWTGEEVGKAIVASLLCDIEHAGQEDYPHLFTQADLEKMESSLSTEKDFLVYAVYRAIFSSVLEKYNSVQEIKHKFANGYYRLVNYLSTAGRADSLLGDLETQPLIMTQTQYDRLAREANEWWAGKTTSLYRLLFMVLSYCITALEAGDENKVPASIREAIQATNFEPATNQRILSHYNEDLGRGYFTLPDGTRSDSMTAQEWKKTLDELYLQTHPLNINGKPATLEETIRHYKSERLVEGFRLFFEGGEAIREAIKKKTGRDYAGDPTELENKLASTILRDERDLATLSNPLANDIHSLYTDEAPTEWHYYEEIPAGLTKYDILSQSLKRYSGECNGDIPEREQLKEFKADYPHLYKALDAYIKERVPTTRTLTPAQIYKEVITRGELAEGGVIGFTNVGKAVPEEITAYLYSQRPAGSARALGGIAIIQSPRSYHQDENGNYKAFTNPLDRLETLDTIAGDAGKREDIRSFRESLVIPATRRLYAYNTLLPIIGQVYGIEDMEKAQVDTDFYERLLNAYNTMLHTMYFNVWGDEREVARKRDLIKDLFQAIDLKELKPTEEAIEQVKSVLTQAGISEDGQKLLSDFDFLMGKLESKEGV